MTSVLRSNWLVVTGYWIFNFGWKVSTREYAIHNTQYTIGFSAMAGDFYSNG